MDNILKDERFSSLETNPKFRSIPKVHRKVKIDKRFRSMFTDKNFQLSYKFDKRGRPINETQAENFKKYYELSSSGEESEENPSEPEEGRNTSIKVEKKGSYPDSENGIASDAKEINEIVSDDVFKDQLINQTKQFSDSEIEDNTDDLNKGKLSDKIKSRLKDMSLDYARGMAVLISDSSSDESSSEDSEEERFEHNWGELDKNTEKTNEVTRRFALCHLDWDRINASDIMVLLHSFLPADGVIESVTIYPSEFGLQRMKEEEINGPKELIENSNQTTKTIVDECDSDENPEGDKYHMEKLRQYQLNRLKYYYAVVVCNTVETSNKLYTECDGMEYESSSTKIDMRFIPDDMTFDQEPKEVCTSLPDIAKYSPRLFANTALRQIKVDLTWDETDPNRIDFTKKVISGEDIPEENLKEYIASSSDEGNSDIGGNLDHAGDEANDFDDGGSICEEGKNISKYHSLLAAIKDEKEKKEKRDVEMEITWEVGLKDKTEKLVEEKRKPKLTPFEKIIQNKRARRRQIKEKYKSKDDDLCSDDDLPANVDLDDPYFKDEIKDVKGKKKSCKFGSKESNVTELNQQKELELLLAENEGEKGKSHFNFKDIQNMESKSKKKQQKLIKKNNLLNEDDFKVDVKDERFSAMYSSHLYNIDPADPHFRKTKGTEEFIKEKLKRKVFCDSETKPIKKPKL